MHLRDGPVAVGGAEASTALIHDLLGLGLPGLVHLWFVKHQAKY